MSVRLCVRVCVCVCVGVIMPVRHLHICMLIARYDCVHQPIVAQVVEGMDVVRAMEAAGSRDGKTSKAVVIAASGQL